MTYERDWPAAQKQKFALPVPLHVLTYAFSCSHPLIQSLAATIAAQNPDVDPAHPSLTEAAASTAHDLASGILAASEPGRLDADLAVSSDPARHGATAASAAAYRSNQRLALLTFMAVARRLAGAEDEG
jgi:hypothetical protein